MSLTIATHTAGTGTHAWRASGPRDFARLIRGARRHSARVRVMRIGVPVVALAGVGLLVLAAWLNPLRSLPDLPVSAGNLVVSGTKITMEAPKLTGFTRDNRAYNLTAEAAAQDITNPTVLELTGIRAKVELQNSASVDMTAVAGLYNTKSELLTLSQYIVLITSDGYEGHLTEATADMRKGTVLSEKPVEVFLPNGKLDSKRMEILDNGGLLRFDAGVKVHLVSSESRGTAATGARPANAPQGFSISRDKPVDVTATTLEVRDKDKKATFIGNVLVTQADTTMKSKTLDVYYDQDGDPATAKAPGPSGQQIRKMEARGGVTIAQKGQTATGETGVFDMRTNIVTLVGGVTVTQGPQTIKGDHLSVDLTTNVSRVEGGVSGVMFPNNQPRPGETKPGARETQAMSGPPNALQGFSVNRDKPIQVTSTVLEVRDKEKKATFSGSVVVAQGDTTMKSKTLDIYYDQDDESSDGKAAQGGPFGQQQVRQLEAKGGVVVTQKDQTATGETGIFDMPANTVTLIGGVVITQGPQVIKGERLTVDLATGVSHVEGGVSGLFLPNRSKLGEMRDGKSRDTKAADTRSGEAKAETAKPESGRKDAGKPSRSGQPMKLN